MKNVFQPLFSSLIKLIGLSILAVPILAIVQWLTPDHIKPFSTYMEFLGFLWENYILVWGDWFIIVLLSYKFATSLSTYYKVAEEIRMRRFIQEVQRWERTPYIPPLMLYYLMAPPVSYSPYLRDSVTNTFYKTVVNSFRNRAYMDLGFTDADPQHKSHWLKVVGLSKWIPPLLGGLLILTFFYQLFQTKPMNEWFLGWERFAIPLLVLLGSWIGQQLYAIMVIGKGKLVEQALFECFQQVEPRISWRDAFPDRHYGEIILKAWSAASERQQRNYYEFQCRPLPANNELIMDCPSLAPYPFPSQSIPEWAGEMEEYIYQEIDRWREEKHDLAQKAIYKSKGRIVPFEKKRKTK
ncbi:hypothetical protein [Ammoniphilus resinae]|uniref:Uncharacterized protein n=1 Tax=Ammoniphilus resinae TaxID=861532 RepID=A0ABS4GNB0_9BACL|nr:hypothetical protein [Ammoniphilus resinae]MBP1931772.1 hypothetical protein [Ammoniphilus resinae]